MEHTHVLVINDEPDIMAQMKKWLSGYNFILTCTAQGSKGIAIAKHGRFDIILLDFNLKKEEDGEKTAEYFIPTLKRLCHNIPIILVTATAENLNAAALGVDKVVILESTIWKELPSIIAAAVDKWKGEHIEASRPCH